jgi:hypothetical protein
VAHNRKPTEAERELQAYADELSIMKHAQRLADIAGCARATKALHSALLDIERKAADGAVKLTLSQAIARPSGSH